MFVNNYPLNIKVLLKKLTKFFIIVDKEKKGIIITFGT